MIKSDFHDLRALAWKIVDVQVAESSTELEEFKKRVIDGVKKRYTLSSLKDEKIFRRYRDFFWRIGIDPTKTRPASEALIRRVLQGKSLPRINTLVDAYNLASMKSGIALAAFDLDKVCVEEGLLLRRASPGERFRGIGMQKDKVLNGGEVVLDDGEKLIAVYPYRDSDETKITVKTRGVLLVSCGVPGIGEEELTAAGSLGAEYITRFCGGFSVFEK
jgi:DNA/RNA-binding domain of Phe-tRNA-synthetase-like protein